MVKRGLVRIPPNKQRLVKSELIRLRAAIQRHRQDLGFTQESLSEKIGISQVMLASIESGVRVPSLPMLITIFDTLGLKLVPKSK